MVAKYGVNSIWDPREMCDGFGTRIWKSILKERLIYGVTFDLSWVLVMISDFGMIYGVVRRSR